MLCPTCNEHRFPTTAKKVKAVSNQKRTSACGGCKKTVTGGQKGLQCQLCELWYHIECEDISESVYAFLQENTKESTIHWFCHKCSGVAAKMLQSITKLEQRQEKLENRQDRTEQRADMMEKRQDSVEMELESLRSNIDKMKDNLGADVKKDMEEQKQSWADTLFKQVDSKMEKIQDGIIEVKLAESMEEVRDRESRKTNVIMFGLEESEERETDKRIKHDTEKLEDVLESIKCDNLKPRVKKLIRLGRPATEEEMRQKKNRDH